MFFNLSDIGGIIMNMGILIIIGLSICVVCTLVNYFTGNLTTTCDTVEDMGFITGHLIIAVLGIIIGSLVFSTTDSFTEKMICIIIFASIMIIALIKPIKTLVELIQDNSMITGIMAFVSFVLGGALVITVGVIWLAIQILPGFVWVLALLLDGIDD